VQIWYAIDNGGDGSVSLRLFESEELAEWYDEFLLEGWGESSVGSIEITGTCTDNVHTAEICKLDMQADLEDEATDKYQALLGIIEKKKAERKAFQNVLSRMPTMANRCKRDDI